MDVLSRMINRIQDDTVPDYLLYEYVVTVSDRLCIRLGVDKLPVQFESICVDASVKMYRRTYYEGISSEGAANVSTSFVDDILNEYSQEIGCFRMNRANSGSGSGKVVTFL